MASGPPIPELRVPPHDRGPPKRDDGFGFSPTRSNPAKERSRPVEADDSTISSQRKVPLDLTASVRQENLDRVFTETSHHIFQRKSGGWYARLPDVDVDVPQHQGERHETFLSTDTQKDESSTQLELALEWENSKIDANRHGLRFFDVRQNRQENAAEPKASQDGSSTEGEKSFSSHDVDAVPRLFWRHDVYKNLGISKLLRMVEQCKYAQLTDSEYGLTKRLLKTLGKISEREYTGGKYLVPLSLRYDNQDVSKYTVDKTCIFFCFPYLSLDPLTRRVYYTKSDKKHPPRTLLQSHYRLNKTDDRDELQCITWLKTCQVHVPGENPTPSDKSRSFNVFRKREPPNLFFVPQFWGLIVGLDTLLTLGVAEEKNLRGSSVEIQKRETPLPNVALSLVKILFYHNDQPEDVIFPLSQCDSCFGLLNKKQQIIEYLKKENKKEDEKGDQKSKKEEEEEEGDDVVSMTDLNKYQFWREDDCSLITNQNWEGVLCEAYSREMLTIWMREDMPKNAGDTPSKPDSTSTSESSTGRASKECDATSWKINTPAFLNWRMQDEFGEEDKTELAIRVAKFLRAIYLKLPIPAKMTPKERKTQSRDLSKNSAQAGAHVEIRQKTLKDVLGHVNDPEIAKLAKEMIEKSKVLLLMFIPAEVGVDCESDALRIFWGALDALLMRANFDRDFRTQLRTFTELIEELIRKAYIIHHGVRSLRPEMCAGAKQPQASNKVADSVILLATIVDSLGAIFHMYVEAARFSKCRFPEDKDGMMSQTFKVYHYGKTALDLLETSISQLVSEAEGHGDDTKNSVGPVLTPEAVSIALMERLLDGVHESGPIDIVHVYEACLEHLTLKVKYEASRRLLQKINEFLEEVMIVIDVLNQQDTVLRQLRENLNPETFQNTIVARKLRYKYECRGIEKLLTGIAGKTASFSELHRRAQYLSTENVRLVETLQDDNSKAIFIFTLVTVLFLPLSFVAGFFGMNLKGINGSERDYWHFWKIGLPMTAGIFLICGYVTAKGEDTYFAIGRLWRAVRYSKK